jgi:hypothetical protein
VKIGDSLRAPLFNLVAQPNDWQKQVRAATQGRALTAKGALYADFWAQFLEEVQARHPDWTRARARNPNNWFEMKSGIRGTWFSLSFAQNDRLRYELCIDSGDGDQNLELFEHLRNGQDQIEASYGRPLTWDEPAGRRSCRIADHNDACAVTELDRHNEFIDWFLDAGTRMRQALAEVAPPLTA